jgi:hypothetical protein
MERRVFFKEIKIHDIVSDNLLQQWVETNRQTKGIHYKQEGKNILILISGGERPTGGYKVVIDEAVMEAPDSVYVSARVTVPRAETMVKQEITYPYACMQIEDENIKYVQGTLAD